MPGTSLSKGVKERGQERSKKPALKITARGFRLFPVQNDKYANETTKKKIKIRFPITEKIFAPVFFKNRLSLIFSHSRIYILDGLKV